MLKASRMAATTGNSRGFCYVILIFNDITQLLCCLWSIWDDRNTYILVVDEKSSSKCKALCELLCKSFENVTCIRGHYGTWGGYSLVSVAASGIRAGLERSANWQHLFLISGNHAALQDQDRIHSCLTPGKSYLRHEWTPRIPRPSEDDFLALSDNHRRLWGWWEELPGIKMEMTGIRSELPDVHFFKGSQWVALSRQACEALQGRVALELSDFFAHTFVADESFFHTIIRAIEAPEDILPIATTYHGWHGGRSTFIQEGDYRTAARDGWWLCRKLPKTIPPSYLALIQKHCRAADFDSFLNRVNVSSPPGAGIEFKDDSVNVTTPGHGETDGVTLRSKYEKAIVTLRQVAGAAAIVGHCRGDVLDIRIEPSAAPPGRSPIVGVARSSDGKTIWLRILLRAELYSSSVATPLASNGNLRNLVDDAFPETHMEPHFREVFQRKYRTAFVFEADQMESEDSGSRLREYFKLLAEGWSCLGLATEPGRVEQVTAAIPGDRVK